jgi:hypothetical protein
MQRHYRYASHGLRFDVKRPTESTDEFRKRLNQQALDEDEEKPIADGAASDWYLGDQARNRGSVHSDFWVGTAADLADRHVVGIYPVTDWSKDQPKRDRSEMGARYSLREVEPPTRSGIDTAHLIPEAAGGHRTTLLCKKCNNEFGRCQDRWLGDFLNLGAITSF